MVISSGPRMARGEETIMAKRYFGNVRKRASGRFQARYTGPDGHTYSAPTTFDSKQYADAWLRRVSGEIQAGRWGPPEAVKVDQPAAPINFGAYAETWLAGR